MKKIISAFLAGILVASAISVFAATYIAETANFKVMVNGENFETDKPVLAVDGSTYLPLKAIGEALGVPVIWNNELRQVEVGNSATIAEANQYSRTNPAPIDTVQNYTKASKYFEEDNYTVAVRVMETIRGEKAYRIIKDINTFNTEADPGCEYMLVKVAFSVLSTQGDYTVEPTEYNFKSFTSNNEEVQSKFIVLGEDYPELSGQIYAGGNTEGWIAIQVKKDDTNPKLAYGLNYDGSGGTWFSLSE